LILRNQSYQVMFWIYGGSFFMGSATKQVDGYNIFDGNYLHQGSTYILEENLREELENSKNFAANKAYFPTKTCEGDNWLQCLKEKSTSELNQAQLKLFRQKLLSFTPFKPIIGDKFLPKTCVQSLIDADFKTDVQLLIGHTSMEGMSFAYNIDRFLNLSDRYNPKVMSRVTKDQIKNDIKLFARDQDFAEEIARAYTQGISNGSNWNRDLVRSGAHAYGDMLMTCPTIIFGSELTKHSSFKGSVFQYRLTYANSHSISYDSQWAEAKHTDEVPLVFGRPFNELHNNWTADDKKMSEVVMRIWTDFAKYG
jgi:carboxylesterase type B